MLELKGHMGLGQLEGHNIGRWAHDNVKLQIVRTALDVHIVYPRAWKQWPGRALSDGYYCHTHTRAPLDSTETVPLQSHSIQNID